MKLVLLQNYLVALQHFGSTSSAKVWEVLVNQIHMYYPCSKIFLDILLMFELVKGIKFNSPRIVNKFMYHFLRFLKNNFAAFHCRNPLI